jgi:excisionase family DNA binding protein
MDKLLTYRDASRLLQIPVGTLQWMVNDHRIPHVRLGPRTVRFERAALEAWVAERRVDG